MDIANYDSRFLILPIKKIIDENSTTKTFVFEHSLGGNPGQFLMMWIPGVDEKPMSIAYDDGKEFWITVCNVGETSNALHGLKEGDKVGVRGPLGTSYEFGKGDHLALVAGGYGAAPMYFVAKQAVEKGIKIEFLVGARNEDLLLYIDKIKDLEGVTLHISTDDGSAGHKGYVTEVLKEVLAEGNVNKVFTCGPEVMMKVVGQVADYAKVESWLSMEKYMKCGIGVCGQCAIDDTGDLVCTKGPVMSWKYLQNLPEMGKYHRDAQGKKHNF
ncbi:MAG: dihydroorotate dehydrogenase electron transfer subunit [bacterium]|nr:dihydroorotate dehydrogenase electron transfer subunit [bacterium]